MNKTIHKCNWDTIVWEPDGYHIAGCGETLERDGKCKVCGKTFREVYIHSCIINEETDEEVSLFGGNE